MPASSWSDPGLNPAAGIAASSRPRGRGMTSVRPALLNVLLPIPGVRCTDKNRILPSRDHFTKHPPLHKGWRLPSFSEIAYVPTGLDGSIKPDATAHSPSGDAPSSPRIGDSITRDN